MSQTPKPSFWSPENLRSILILVVLIFAFRWSIASPYHVPTPSMEPTIKVGDRLLALKLSYGLKVPFTDYSLLEWGTPQRGDIIVFKFPKDPEIDYVKRVVAVAGDKIQFINNRMYLNGKEQPMTDHNEDRAILSDIKDNPGGKLLYKEDLEGLDHWVILNKNRVSPLDIGNWPADGQPYVVPEDSVFVVGDNRDNSLDSRSWYQVPLSYVKGKAQFVLWSLHDEPGSTLPGLRTNRFGHVIK